MTSQFRDPLRDLVALQDRMSRLFEDTLRSRGGEEEAAGGAWMPVADIYEREGNLVVTLELPGVNRDQVDIRLENNLLTVQGERALPAGVDRRSFHRMERSYGRFSRNFTLPAGFDPEGINAAYGDGLLTIRIPKHSESRSRHIEIK